MSKFSLLPSKTSLIILFAVIGAVGTFWVLNSNFRQHKDIKKVLQVNFSDGDALQYVVLPMNDAMDSSDSVKTGKYPEILKTETVTPRQDNFLFHYSPHFFVWTLLVMIMIAIAMGSLPVFVIACKNLLDYCGENANRWYTSTLWWQTLIITLLFATPLAVVTLFLKGLYRPAHILRDFEILLDGAEILIPAFAILPLALLAPVMFFIILIGTGVDQLASRENKMLVAIDLIKLNRSLKGALQILAAIVVLSLLCSTALRLSIKEVIHIKNFDILPEQVSYVYGLFFTLFLGILYFPVQFYLKHHRDALVDSEKVKNATGADATTTLTDLLQPIEQSGSQFKTLLTVFSPLITSLITSMPDIFA